MCNRSSSTPTDRRIGHKCVKCGLMWGNNACLNGDCVVRSSAISFDGEPLVCGLCNEGKWLWGASETGYITTDGLTQDEFDAWVWAVRKGTNNATKS